MGENSNLAKKDNAMGKLIDYTVGEWLQNVDESDFINQLFLQEATGKYLDVQGSIYNVKRKIDESDDDYRQRIVYECLGHLTVDFLVDVYNLEVYYFIEDFNVNDNTLTSDNPFLNVNGFMAVADAETRSILDKKFVLDNTISWLIL